MINLNDLKNALKNERDFNKQGKSELSYKILALFENYENNNDTKSINTLIFVMETYTNISKNGKIEFKMPIEIEYKIRKLYEKKISTYRFGSKTAESYLDELIIEADM